MPGHTKPNIVVSHLTIPWWISPCRKSKKLMLTSRDVDDQRILQSDWTWAFWPITSEPKMGLHRKTENCNALHFRLFPAESNDKISWKVKKTQFWALFPYFSTKKNSHENPRLSLLFPDFYSCAEIQKKTNEQNPRKLGCRHMDGHTNKHKYIGPPLLGV